MTTTVTLTEPHVEPVRLSSVTFGTIFSFVDTPLIYYILGDDDVAIQIGSRGDQLRLNAHWRTGDKTQPDHFERFVYTYDAEITLTQVL
jgi:hypothetical protein